MLNKSLIKKNFSKCVHTYNDSAVVQVYMAKQLVNMLQLHGFSGFEKVLEIGAGTGLLTSILLRNIVVSSYYANDIIDNYHDFLLAISSGINFLDGDIEQIKIEEKFDLVIANAVFQWIEDKDSFLKKVKESLTKNGVLAFTTFAKDNFKEIKDVFGVSLDYLDKEELFSVLSKQFKVKEIFETEKQLLFDDYLSIFAHIKATGTNNLSSNKISNKQLREKEMLYKERYYIDGKWTLTYNPMWVVCLL